MKSVNKVRVIVLSAIVFCLAFLNIYFSEIPNFSPIAATALFAGAFMKNRKLDSCRSAAIKCLNL